MDVSAAWAQARISRAAATCFRLSSQAESGKSAEEQDLEVDRFGRLKIGRLELLHQLPNPLGLQIGERVGVHGESVGIHGRSGQASHCEQTVTARLPE